MFTSRCATIVVFSILLALGADAKAEWGNDVEVTNDGYKPAIDVASNGDIYLVTAASAEQINDFIVYRSSDQGLSWSQWGPIIDSNNRLYDPRILVAEGISNWVIVSFTTNYPSVRTARRSLSNQGDWEFETVETGECDYMPDLCKDTDYEYYVYIVYCIDNEVKFAYSINSAGSWLDQHISTISPNGRKPNIAYGRHESQKLVVIWQDINDNTIYRKYSENYGSTWSSQSVIANPSNTARYIDLAGSHYGGNQLGTFFTFYTLGANNGSVAFVSSTTGGSGWNIQEQILYSPLVIPLKISCTVDNNGIYHLGFCDGDNICYSKSTDQNPTSPNDWLQEPIIINDDETNNGHYIDIIANDDMVYMCWEIEETGRDPIMVDKSDILTSKVDEIKNITYPNGFTLTTAYPNPFNPVTMITVTLATRSELNVKVFNITGQQVAELANGQFNAGTHAMTFDASNLASGLYFIHATVPGHLDQVQKVVLVR